MYIEFNAIPDSIKKSKSVQVVKRKMEFWEVRKLLEEYMQAYKQGVMVYDPEVQINQRFKEIQLENICIYFLLRKEFLKRMSPVIGKRSKEFIAIDNKVLLDKFDKCLNKGIEKDFEKSQSLMVEIIKRIG